MIEKQRAEAEEPTQTASGSLEHGKRRLKLDVLTKSVSANRHLLTWRRLLVGAVAVLALAAVWDLVIPWIRLALNTVSTDDAFVNGHVTFVAARVSGQVSRVLVDDNNRVQKGDLLVELDKEPYRIAVAEKQAAVDVAKADLRVATSMARGIEAQARSQRWKLQQTMEDVENRIALLHARIAALDKNKAALT
jgi:membrane fusion protein, multidrug efflux system